jgi:hypothetical protein
VFSAYGKEHALDLEIKGDLFLSFRYAFTLTRISSIGSAFVRCVSHDRPAY